MLPEQLWRVIRRYWLVVGTIVVLSVVGFVAVALHAPRPFKSTVTLQVQATNPDQQNTNFLQATVPGVQVVLGSQKLHDLVRKDTKGYAGDINVSVTPTPNSGVLAVTVSSLSEDLVVPALNAYATEIGSYGKAYDQQVQIKTLQPATSPARDSAARVVVVAAIEGLIFGFALAIFVALGLARWSESRDRLGRLESNQGLKTLIRLPEPREQGAGREDEFVLLAADVRADVLSRRASSFAVVSPRTSTTRSVVAAQLARGLAIAGHRVLLVDADLRTPHLEAALASIDASPIAAFTGMSWLPTETTPVPNLVVMRGGSLAKVVEHLGMQGAGPVRLVSGSIASLVGECRNANVVLVIDCPATDGAAEANAVISGVDAVVMVTSGSLHRKDVDRLGRLKDTIDKLGTEVVGLVAGPKKEYVLRPVPARSPV